MQMLPKLLQHIPWHSLRRRAFEQLRAMSTPGPAGSRPLPSDAGNTLIGVCQLTSTADKKQNFLMAKTLIERASNRGAKVRTIGVPRAFYKYLYMYAVIYGIYKYMVILSYLHFIRNARLKSIRSSE